MRLRNAVITAATLEVCCPHCGDPQPNPRDGSHLWMPEEVKQQIAETVQRVCVACDEPFALIEQSRVSVPGSENAPSVTVDVA